MIRIDKIVKELPIILLFAAVILLLVNNEISKKNNVTVEIIVGILFFISFFIELYLDIKSKRYTTFIFIIISDIVKIAALMVLLYYYFHHYDIINMDYRWKRNIIMHKSGFWLVIMESVKRLFESQRFEKTNDKL
jgi:hypothetical protein